MVYQLIADRGSRRIRGKNRGRQDETGSCITATKPASAKSKSSTICTISWSLTRTEYEFFGQCFSFHTTGLFILSLVVGLIGGIYGIGGGAIIAPFIVSFFHLPIHTIAGATLMGTCVTSIGGVIFYPLVGPHFAAAGAAVSPDWLLGFLFGIGGFVGMYLGARTQKYVPAAIIQAGFSDFDFRRRIAICGRLFLVRFQDFF